MKEQTNTRMDNLTQIANQLGLKVGRMVGSGIHMSQQTYYSVTLQPGDYAWDADWGYIMYTGKGWYPFLNEQTTNQD